MGVSTNAGLAACGLALLLSGSGLAAEPKPSYPSMAPLEQYLMPAADEIALARSAAPRIDFRRRGRHGSHRPWL